MPQYCYTSSEGQTVERLFSMGKAPRTVTEGDICFVRDIPAEWDGRRNSDPYPKLSDALGVLGSQASEASRHLHEQGVPTEFTSDGRCVVESNSHQNRIMEALGMHDRDACYSQRAKP